MATVLYQRVIHVLRRMALFIPPLLFPATKRWHKTGGAVYLDDEKKSPFEFRTYDKVRSDSVYVDGGKNNAKIQISNLRRKATLPGSSSLERESTDLFANYERLVSEIDFVF